MAMKHVTYDHPIVVNTLNGRCEGVLLIVSKIWRGERVVGWLPITVAPSTQQKNSIVQLISSYLQPSRQLTISFITCMEDCSPSGQIMQLYSG